VPEATKAPNIERASKGSAITSTHGAAENETRVSVEEEMANSRGAEVVLLRWSPEENPAVGVV